MGKAECVPVLCVRYMCLIGSLNTEAIIEKDYDLFKSLKALWSITRMVPIEITTVVPPCCITLFTCLICQRLLQRRTSKPASRATLAAKGISGMGLNTLTHSCECPSESEMSRQLHQLLESFQKNNPQSGTLALAAALLRYTHTHTHHGTDAGGTATRTHNWP